MPVTGRRNLPIHADGRKFEPAKRIGGFINVAKTLNPAVEVHRGKQPESGEKRNMPVERPTLVQSGHNNENSAIVSSASSLAIQEVRVKRMKSDLLLWFCVLDHSTKDARTTRDEVDSSPFVGTY